VKTAGPGRHSDGTVKGLMLMVRDNGSRAWVLRYQVGGRRRDMGLGPFPRSAWQMHARKRSTLAG
jgi:hypothetical protein